MGIYITIKICKKCLFKNIYAGYLSDIDWSYEYNQCFIL